MSQQLEIQGVKHLAVSVGIPSRGTALTRILALKGAVGWHVVKDVIHEWRFDGMTESAGSVFLYGPLASGRELAAVAALPLAEALPYLSLLVRALQRLEEAKVPWFALQMDAVLFTDEGGVLFLPPDVFREIRDLQTFSVNRDSFEALNHPDLRGEKLASFSIAALLYRIITGRLAFTGKDAEELHEQVRKLEIAPPSSVVPELQPEISSVVMAGLGRGRQAAVSLSDWRAQLDSWPKQPLYRTLTPEDREKRLKEAGDRQQGSEKSFRRRMFLEKNWKLMAIIAAVVVVVGAILGSILGNALAPRVTRGYTPVKVVETFYTSMNTLNHAVMEACVVNKAGQGEVNEAMTLFVTSRVTMGYEGKSNVISADDWDKAGRPPLVSPSTLYGVTGLSITQEQPEPAPVFLVKYDKWNPASPPDTGKMPSATDAPLTEGHRVVDRVAMKKDKGDWVIYKIDRLQSDLLPSPATAAAPAPTPATP